MTGRRVLGGFLESCKQRMASAGRGGFRYLALLLVLHVAVSIGIVLYWQRADRYPVTGDEPHYLVMAGGIARYGTLEQTMPYAVEFRTREIFRDDLQPEWSLPMPTNTHAVWGPTGLYSRHGVGLPALIAGPFSLFGVAGVKVFLALLVGAAAVLITWTLSGEFTDDPRIRFSATAATCIGAPLIPNASQIYPDLLGGVIALSGVHWLFTFAWRRSAVRELLRASALAALPWLHVKLTAACVVLVGALAWRYAFTRKAYRRSILVLGPPAASLAALAAYHLGAFGNPLGSYEGGALALTPHSLMVLVGLFLDQNQGFLFQSPVMFVGLLALGALFTVDRTATVVWAVVLLSLVVPNALHPNWYGGRSFSGRFGWAGAIVFFLPTVAGVTRIASARARIALVATSAVVQGVFLYVAVFTGTSLLNRSEATARPPSLDAYSIHFPRIHMLLPALYDEARAFSYLPNYFWVVVASALVVLGFVRAQSRGATLTAAERAPRTPTAS